MSSADLAFDQPLEGVFRSPGKTSAGSAGRGLRRSYWRAGFGSGNRMALSRAEKQQRYRDKLKAQAQTRPDMIEQALLAEVERAGDLSVEERVALADKLADLANHHLWRAQKLAEIARKLRPPGWNPPGAPP